MPWLPAILIAFVPPQGRFVGHWVGHISGDLPQMLTKAHTPEHRKLLTYTVERLGKATLTLDISPDGTYRWFFDDSFPPDLERVQGRWRADAHNVFLGAFRAPNNVKLLAVEPSTGNLMTSFHGVVGLTVRFATR